MLCLGHVGILKKSNVRFAAVWGTLGVLQTKMHKKIPLKQALEALHVTRWERSHSRCEVERGLKAIFGAGHEANMRGR